MEIFREKKALLFKTRKQLRKWLEKNHGSHDPIWLILHNKASAVTSVKYDEAVEEALCFGWIDSVVYKRDENSRYQFFSKRKPASNWSQSNRDRVAKLSASGLIAEAGQKMIDYAKENGTWESSLDIDNLIIPDDLQKLFNKNKNAWKNYEAFSLSTKKLILQWIKSAKRPETREERLMVTVSMAEKNEKAR